MRHSLRLILLVLFIGFTTACANPDSGKVSEESPKCGSTIPTPAPQVAKISGKYTRLAKTGEDSYALELAIRSFKPVAGEGPEVVLISAIHIGSKEYYEKLQAAIDAPKLLLFEGVSDKHKQAEPAKDEESNTEGLYEQLAHPLGLVTQLESLDYKRANFKNADLSLQELHEILKNEAALDNRKGAAAREALEYFTKFEKLLSGSDAYTSFIMQSFFGIIGSSPQFRTVFLFHLATAEDGASSGGMMTTPGLQRVMRLILHDRNKAVMEMLSKEISQPDAPASIGVFYGAAHLSGMEKILVQKMGYQLADTRWITAYTIHPKAAGLDNTMIENLTRNAVEKK